MKIELITGGKMPQRMTKGAIGFDVFARKVYIHEHHLMSAFCGKSMFKKPTGATIHLGFKIDCNFETMFTGRRDKDAVLMNFAAMLLPHSGWGTEYGFRLLNTTGVIDPDYRGEVIMKVAFNECPPELLEFANSDCNGCFNRNMEDFCYICSSSSLWQRMEQPRVGQILIVPCYVGELQQVDSLDETERGEGGFGSTDE